MRRFIKIVATLFCLAGLLILGFAWYLGLLTPGSGNIVLPGQTGESTNYEGEEGKSGPGRPTDKLENDYANRGESAVDPENATVGDIEKKYRPKFAALQQEYDAKINSLAAAGMNEYMSYKNNNQKPPVAQLIRKYLNAGRVFSNL